VAIPLTILAIVAAVLSSGTPVFVPAIVNAVASFGANAVLATYGRKEAQEAPNWVANVSMLTALGSAILLVLSFVLDD
jgi:hypothetical protein